MKTKSKLILALCWSMFIPTVAIGQLLDTTEVEAFLSSIDDPIKFCSCNSSSRGQPFYSKPLPPGLSLQQAESRCDNLKGSKVGITNQSSGEVGGMVTLTSCGVNVYAREHQMMFNASPSGADTSGILSKINELQSEVDKLKSSRRLAVPHSSPSQPSRSEPERYPDKPWEAKPYVDPKPPGWSPGGR